MQLVEGKRTYRDQGEKKGPIALPRPEKIKLRRLRNELRYLRCELKARSAAEGEQVAAGGGMAEEAASSAAGADVVFETSDDEEDDDDEGVDE